MPCLKITPSRMSVCEGEIEREEGEILEWRKYQQQILWLRFYT
jgi:hypothetical protein